MGRIGCGANILYNNYLIQRSLWHMMRAVFIYNYAQRVLSFYKPFHDLIRRYIRLYRGPPVPSGQVHLILSNGHFRWQVLQCRQFDGFAGLTWPLIFSYTPAGQNVMQGLLNFGVHFCSQVLRFKMVKWFGCSSRCSVAAIAVKLSLSNFKSPLSRYWAMVIAS